VPVWSAGFADAERCKSVYRRDSRLELGCEQTLVALCGLCPPVCPAGGGLSFSSRPLTLPILRQERQALDESHIKQHGLADYVEYQARPACLSDGSYFSHQPANPAYPGPSGKITFRPDTHRYYSAKKTLLAMTTLLPGGSVRWLFVCARP